MDNLSEEAARIRHRILLVTLGYSHAACIEALESALKLLRVQSGETEKRG
jgi:hypothetical protein